MPESEISIKGWNKFQHFKDRKPPWIKLYRDILDDLEWHKLSGDAAKLLVMLWLLASETDGYLPDIKVISFRFRIDIKECKKLISELKHYLDINMISDGYQSDSLETETETELETEKEKEIVVSDDVLYIITYLNELTGKKFRATTEANKKLIRARIADGYTVDDFMTVIRKKAAQWMNTEQEQYIRPETLFCAKHFDGYLNQPEVIVKDGDLFSRPQSDAMKEITAKIPEAQKLCP